MDTNNTFKVSKLSLSAYSFIVYSLVFTADKLRVIDGGILSGIVIGIAPFFWYSGLYQIANFYRLTFLKFCIWSIWLMMLIDVFVPTDFLSTPIRWLMGICMLVTSWAMSTLTSKLGQPVLWAIAANVVGALTLGFGWGEGYMLTILISGLMTFAFVNLYFFVIDMHLTNNQINADV